MKEKILKLSKRLKSFSLNEIATILEMEEKDIKPMLDELVLENRLSLTAKTYLFNKQVSSRGCISKLPLFFHFHSPEVIDLILKGFCSDIPVNQMCNLVGLHKNVTGKFYIYFRKLIYDDQKKELERYFTLNPMQGKERKWFNANAFLYIYNNKLFVSDKILKSIDCSKYSEVERLEIKKQYLRCFRKVQNNSYKHKFYLHLTEEIWKYGKDFLKRYELLKTLINC